MFFFQIELLPTTSVTLKFQPFYVDFLNSPSQRLYVYLLLETLCPQPLTEFEQLLHQKHGHDSDFQMNT